MSFVRVAVTAVLIFPSDDLPASDAVATAVTGTLKAAGFFVKWVEAERVEDDVGGVILRDLDYEDSLEDDDV